MKCSNCGEEFNPSGTFWKPASLCRPCFGAQGAARNRRAKA